MNEPKAEGRVLRVALTGGIATGKTYVRRRLEAAGVPTIDSDQLARDAVAVGSPGLAAIAERFGPGVLLPDGSLNRPAMGRLVFTDPAARRDLEAIVHPIVRARTTAFFESLEALGRVPFAVADIPLLFETGRDREFRAVIVTACSQATQIARLMARDELTRAEADARIDAQWPIEEKKRRADYVIDTDGDFARTDAQVDAVVEKLRDAALAGE